MGKYRKLLVAFDGSDSSKNALRQAIKLARTEQSWIKVVAVVPSYEGDLSLVGVSNIKEVLKGPSQRLLEEANEIATAERASIMTNIEQGEAYEKIVDVAGEENCDIIIMGRSGMHNLERVLVGSVTARVIGHSRKDVLVVPANGLIGWKNIFLATDGSKNSYSATEKAINFTHSYGGNLHAVSAVNLYDEYYAEAPALVDELVHKAKDHLDDVKRRAGSEGVSAKTYVREGESYRVIIEIAKEENADLIVMGSHGRTGLKRLLMGSVTEMVIGHAFCPVLIVKS